MDIPSLINLIQDGGFVVLLIVLAIPKLKQKFFGLNGYDIMKIEMARIADRLSKHMDDEEVEMKGIKQDITDIKETVSYIKGKLEK